MKWVPDIQFSKWSSLRVLFVPACPCQRDAQSSNSTESAVASVNRSHSALAKRSTWIPQEAGQYIMHACDRVKCMQYALCHQASQHTLFSSQPHRKWSKNKDWRGCSTVKNPWLLSTTRQSNTSLRSIWMSCVTSAAKACHEWYLHAWDYAQCMPKSRLSIRFPCWTNTRPTPITFMDVLMVVPLAGRPHDRQSGPMWSRHPGRSCRAAKRATLGEKAADRGPNSTQLQMLQCALSITYKNNSTTAQIARTC